MAYDRIDWHSDSDNFPAELPYEAGATHLGQYLAGHPRGVVGEFHRRASADSLAAVRQRRTEDLGPIGNAFTEAYYAAEGPGSYLVDYNGCLGADLPTLYHVADTWENFDRIAARLDQRFDEWRRDRGLE